MRERKPLPAVSLTTNSSVLTAIGNDYDYSEIFSGQIEGICPPRDFVVGISTSGNSMNVVKGGNLSSNGRGIIKMKKGRIFLDRSEMSPGKERRLEDGNIMRAIESSTIDVRGKEVFKLIESA